MRIKSSSSTITKRIAKLLAKKLAGRKSDKTALVVGLVGELGSGKTTFIQGFARGLGVKHRLVSPTFIIMRTCRLQATNYKLLAHIDAYRIKKPNELKLLNFEKILNNPRNIILIEWADKIKKILPKNTIWIKFEHGKKENERIIRISKS